MKKLLSTIQSFKTEQWLGIYGIYLCVILIFVFYDNWDYGGKEVALFTLIPLILLGSIQLFRKTNVISVMYSIPVVVLINLLLSTL